MNVSIEYTAKILAEEEDTLDVLIEKLNRLPPSEFERLLIHMSAVLAGMQHIVTEAIKEIRK